MFENCARATAICPNIAYLRLLMQVSWALAGTSFNELDFRKAIIGHIAVALTQFSNIFSTYLKKLHFTMFYR